MHHQVDVFEPDPKSEYPRQRAQPRTEALVTQPSRPKKRSPLPSAREIDVALEAKYGTARYREL
jgi:hypothetical protein